MSSTVSDHGRASGCESYQILTLENDENPLGRKKSSKVEANNFSDHQWQKNKFS